MTPTDTDQTPPPTVDPNAERFAWTAWPVIVPPPPKDTPPSDDKDPRSIHLYGTSEGIIKGWETRRGHGGGGEERPSSARGPRRGESGDFLHSPKDAVKSLLNHEQVNIAREDIRDFLKEAVKEKEDADLTDVQVDGMLIFGGNGLGISRAKMPQVPKELREEFYQGLKDKGVTMTRESVSPLDLAPTQKEISAKIVQEKIDKYKDDPSKPFVPIIVAEDGHVLEGHHHWGMMAALAADDPSIKIPIVRVHQKPHEALAEMHAFDKQHGIKPKPLLRTHQVDAAATLDAIHLYGTSDGQIKGWETRHRGGEGNPDGETHGERARQPQITAEGVWDEPPDGYVRIYRGVNPERNTIASDDDTHGLWYTTTYDDAASYANWDYDGADGLGPGRAIRSIDVPLADAFGFAQDGSRHKIEDSSELLDPDRPVEMLVDSEVARKSIVYEGDEGEAKRGGVRDMATIHPVNAYRAKLAAFQLYGTTEGILKGWETRRRGAGGSASDYADNPRVFNTPDDVLSSDSWGKKQWEWKDPKTGKGRGELLAGEPIPREALPETLYHVTTAAPAVESSGVLLGQRSDAGLGGGQADGVSFTSSKEDARVIQRELVRAVKIARGDDRGLDVIERYAREDEKEAGLPPGTLDNAVTFAKSQWREPTEADVWGDYDLDKLWRSRTHDALNAYLQIRGHHDVSLLKNPILFGNQDKLKLLDPDHVSTLTVPTKNIPAKALVTTGSDKFLHEVRVYADVPTEGTTARKLRRDRERAMDLYGTTEGQIKGWETRHAGGEGKQDDEPKPRRTDTPAFKAWFKDSKIVDESGEPLRVYHGTTHDIEQFKEAGAEGLNPESDWGAGVYFTSDAEDASENYAGEGPDLKSRLEQRADQIESEANDGGTTSYDDALAQVEATGQSPHDAAMAQARKELLGKSPSIVPAYLSMQKPFVIGQPNGSSPVNETHFEKEYEYADPDDPDSDIIGEKGSLPDFVAALRDVATSDEYDGGEKAIDKFAEKLYEHDSISASELMKIWKDTEETSYIEGTHGELAQAEVFRKALEQAGFDGVADRTVNDKFGKWGDSRYGHGMEHLTPDTTHFIAFSPTSIKSALGNRTFDPKNPKITMRYRDKLAAFQLYGTSEGVTKGWETRRRGAPDTPEFKAWFGKSKVVDDKGQPIVVYKAMYPYDYRFEKRDPKDGVKGAGAVRVTGPLLESIERQTPFPDFPEEPGAGPVHVAGFFSDKPDVANDFARVAKGSAIYPAYLAMERPFEIDAKGEPAGNAQFGPGGKPFRDAIRSGEYDGVIIKNTKDEGTVYVPLRPTQIKSAIGNTGAFDPKDPRMSMAAGRGTAISLEGTSEGAVKGWETRRRADTMAVRGKSKKHVEQMVESYGLKLNKIEKDEAEGEWVVEVEGGDTELARFSEDTELSADRLAINLPDISDVSFPSMVGAIDPVKPKKKRRRPVLYKGVVKLSRKPMAFEAAVMSLTEIPPRLDMAVQGLMNGGEVAATVQAMADYGAAEVCRELVRQGADPTITPPSVDVSMCVARLEEDRLEEQAAARASIHRRMARTHLRGDKRERVIEHLLSRREPSGAKWRASRAVNEAFSLGRRTAIAHFRAVPTWDPISLAYRDENGKFITDIDAVSGGGLAIDAVVQSAVMDTNTCDECADVDGEVMEFGDDRQEELHPPYVKCLGDSRCRCVQIAILSNGKEINVDEIDEDTLPDDPKADNFDEKVPASFYKQDEDDKDEKD